jgi:hypothetical protein
MTSLVILHVIQTTGPNYMLSGGSNYTTGCKGRYVELPLKDFTM